MSVATNTDSWPTLSCGCVAGWRWDLGKVRQDPLHKSCLLRRAMRRNSICDVPLLRGLFGARSSGSNTALPLTGASRRIQYADALRFRSQRRSRCCCNGCMLFQSIRAHETPCPQTDAYLSRCCSGCRHDPRARL
eukprot:561518-Pleurochrysis_carterae.AAC.2